MRRRRRRNSGLRFRKFWSASRPTISELEWYMKTGMIDGYYKKKADAILARYGVYPRKRRKNPLWRDRDSGRFSGPSRFRRLKSVRHIGGGGWKNPRRTSTAMSANMAKALGFVKRHRGWHSFHSSARTAISKLHRDGLVSLDRKYAMFKITARGRRAAYGL